MKYNSDIDPLYKSIGIQIERYFLDNPEKAELLKSKGIEEIRCCVWDCVCVTIFTNPLTNTIFVIPGILLIEHLEYITENVYVTFKLGKKNK